MNTLSTPTPEIQCNLSSFAPAITWIIVIAGWLVVNSQHNRRETRKEIRSNLDSIISNIEDLENSAISYHTTACNDIDGHKIKVSINHISRNINSLALPLDGNFAYQLAQFRKSITLRNFDSHEHEILPINDEVIDDIGASVQQLIRSLDDAYRDKYQKPWYKKLRCKN